jgi:hypothetical protein
MKKIMFAVLVLSMSSSVGAYDAMENTKSRVDPDEVAYIDVNMLWNDDCEFQLNNRVSSSNNLRNSDGKFKGHYWKETMGVFCDNEFAMSEND